MVYNIISDAGNKWPHNAAVFDGAGTLSFADLHSEVEKLKESLIVSGIAEGMGIGIMARNSRQFIIASFATLGCGAVVLPISHQIKEAELEILIKETELHIIIDDQNGVIPNGSFVKEISVAGEQLRLTQFRTDSSRPVTPHIQNAAFIRFTSGTTGKSKGVIITNEAVIERIDAANKGLQINENDVVIWVLPMAYHFIVSIVLYIKYGAAIAICNDFLAQSIMECSNRYGATFLYASPMHIRLLASDKSNTALGSIKKVISTSTAVSLQVCEAFKKRFEIEVSQAYGIIEIGLPIINLKKSTENPEALGFALPHYQVEMLDEDLKILPPGDIGHLAIKGPGMFDGYLNPPVLKEEILKEGWFLTGDLAVKSEEGLIKLAGRKKSTINVSGNKAFPEEIEEVLESHPDVKAARVFGGTHPLMGEIVQAEIVLEEGKKIETEALITYCREKLSTYKVPQRVSFVKEIPMTTSGKKLRA